jgi:hypothetical protein
MSATEPDWLRAKLCLMFQQLTAHFSCSAARREGQIAVAQKRNPKYSSKAREAKNYRTKCSTT